MPLNVLRLNQRHQHPTERIVFIKSLPGDDASVAEEFLNRVAAICHPILKNNHLSVTTLEEFQPNREFIGRNFNNGECIQLVLKLHSGAWRSFRSVVMVMMHELAHNVHMNHSRDFWKVRNQYAEEMRALWQKGYTGEGIWGPGRAVETGITVGGGREVESDMPEHLCGGAYRSRRRKRVRAPKLSWKEQKERRIAQKFGVNGQALGEDALERNALQGFKGPTTKSRIAGSKRARELRAAAVLARFDKAKTETIKAEPRDGEDSQADDDDDDNAGDSAEEYEDADAGIEDARDVDGSQLKDSKGLGLIRVCGDEDSNDVQVKQEMDELNNLDDIGPNELCAGSRETTTARGSPKPVSKTRQSAHKGSEGAPPPFQSPTRDRTMPRQTEQSGDSEPHPTEVSGATITTDNKISSAEQTCTSCSVANDSAALICAVCSNVLDVSKSPGAWNCGSALCIHSSYMNPADCGICGVCGQRRS